MDSLQLFILALVQGLTEFLPISSSAHLVLPSQILGWADQGLAFDVAVHLGTLSAVLLYFRNDLMQIIRDWTLNTVGRGPKTLHSRQGWFLIWATIPAVVFGGLVSVTGFDEMMRTTAVIAATTLIFGTLLGFADKRKNLTQPLEELTLKQVIIIGLAQAIAIIPGTSRSGITITAGLFLGLTREAAARFSFLMSIPVICAACLLVLLKLVTGTDPVHWGELGMGIVVSGISAYLCIHYFLAFINRIGMMPFVIYRLLLGLVLVGMLCL
ncbi:undecaprenyl-diphosphate phosphatase [Sansalvadorimonas sp. 2012CJ34-2]|uniref:Undecaprenyl-diphosphatase n=1 Tax=Parendozoicomonas callyspongiae TaxID=2942213 RepID=A0ABT0PHV3_9GAMM|nr:undecaprenyl-diphosphate phosphatase [Sansalvadorimonas sp. 2012CJ34-2]MCL6270945.1 undecaprenyl-diphosphate phosphatase [Sansalvadorimonas sp. 2012CJ34-2]